MLSEIAADALREETQFGGAAARVLTLVDYIPHISDIAALLGATPPFLKMLFTKPSLLFRVMFGPATVAQLRLRGPDAKPDVAVSTIESYPPIPMRRLTYISIGLYALSLVVLVCSLALPLTLDKRKSLQPVGFAPWRNKLLVSARYILFWLHAMALAHFYSTIIHVKAGPAIIIILGFLEVNGYLERRKREDSVRRILTSAAEVDTGILIEKSAYPPAKSGSTNNTVIGGYNYGPFVAIAIALTFAVAQGQLAFGFKHPNNRNIMLKKRQDHSKTASSFLISNAGEGLLEALTEHHGFTPLERVALMCRGNLQDIFSAFHLKPMEVSVNYFDLAVTEEEGGVGTCERCPLAIYDRGVDICMSGSPVCIATSKVRVYDNDLLEILTTKQIGIGQFLGVKKLSPEFVLHDAGRNSNGGVWRYYSLICDGIEFDILEKFSPSFFCIDE